MIAPLWLVMVLNLAFGVAYNILVGWLEANGYDEGYTALLVVGGVGATLAITALADWQASLLLFGAFCCSGLPMTVGSWWRHVQKRRRAQESIREEAGY